MGILCEICDALATCSIGVTVSHGIHGTDTDLALRCDDERCIGDGVPKKLDWL